MDVAEDGPAPGLSGSENQGNDHDENPQPYQETSHLIAVLVAHRIDASL